MTKIKSLGVVAIVSVTALLGQQLFWVGSAAQHQPQEPANREAPNRDDNAKLYMQAKLSNAQKVLRGLVSEDFAAIATGAKQMKLIAEAAHWPTTVDEVYQHYGFEFRRQCDNLVRQAEAKDLRAAHFTYLHMSTTCIDCHNYVRPRFQIQRKHDGPVRLIPTEWKGKRRSDATPLPDDASDLSDTYSIQLSALINGES